MAYLTDRKRAVGLGASKTGTEHFWAQTVSSAALLVLVPIFIFVIGSALGQPYEVVVDRLSSPIPALVIALTMTVGWIHFARGIQVLIEDYVGGLARKGLIIATTCLSYALALASLYAILRIAL